MALTKAQLKQIEKSAAANAQKIRSGEFTNKEVAARDAASRNTQTVIDNMTKGVFPAPADKKQTMQKNKEDAAEKAAFPSETERRARDARKALQEYKLTEEYQKNQKKSQQDQYVKGMLFGVKPDYEPDDKEKQLQKEIDYWEGQVTAEKEAAIQQRNVDTVNKWEEADRAALETYILERDKAFYDQINPMTDSGFGTQYSPNVTALIGKYGKSRVDELAESLTRHRNAETAAAVDAKAREQVDKGVLSAVGANLASVGAKALGGYTGIVESAKDLAQNRRIDPNNLGQMANIYAGAVQEQSAGKLEEKFGKPASYLYQGGMALADIGARALAGGGSSAMGATLAATQSFAGTLKEATEQGADPGQAIALATVNSGIEALTEKIPLDELFKVAKGGAKPALQVVGNILKQAGIEAAEEEISLIATTLAEAAILQEKSGYNQQIMQAMANGATEEEAKAQADRALLAEAINTAIVSGISGAASGAGAEYIGARYMVPETGLQVQEEAQQPQTVEQEAGEQTVEMQKQTAQETAQPKQEDNWMANGFREAMGENQKAAVSEETTVNVRSAKTALTEENKAKKTLAYTLASNLDSVRDMQPVSQLTGKELNDRSMKLSDQIAAFFRKLGNKVSRSGFGEVELGEYGVGGMLNHKPLNRAKALSVAAVPDVIRSGQQINYEPNWKGRGYESYTFAGPVTVNGTTVYVAAVVDKRPDNKFYLSEMVDSEGNYVRIEESPSGNSKNELPMGPEHQQGRDYAGPKELSEGSNPSADAEPMPLPNVIVSNERKEVNDDFVNFEGTQQENTYTGAQMGASNDSGQSAEGGQQTQQGNAGEKVPMQRSRPDDVRPIKIPVTDPQGKRVSEAVGNAYGSELTPDDMAAEIEQLVKDGNLGFDVRTNRESLETAAAAIQEKGAAATRNRLTRNIEKGKIRDGDIEQAILLYQKYAGSGKDGDLDNASEMMVDLATMANITGRNLQLFKLLRKMTPEGQLLTLRKEVKRNVESMIRSGQVKKGYTPSIDQALMDDYLAAAKLVQKETDPGKRAEAEKKQQEIQNAIYMAEAAKMPATFKAKWDAWRYMAMLGNAKTQVRNIMGNAMFKPYKATKDTMAALFEKALPRESRTKVLMQDPGLLNWAKADARQEDVRNALKYSAKLGDNASGSVMAENKQVFNSTALDSLRRFVEKVPQAGDMLFKNDYYVRSLAGFLKARGYTAQQVRSGQVDSNVLNEARRYAIDEAMKATFNDSNAFSDSVATIGRRDTDNVWTKTLSTAAEGILPFRRTPANIMVRFTEYSPVGLAKGMWDMAKHISGGDITAADAIDQMASGLTGTGIMMLGYMMAAGMNGVKLTGSGTDEDEKRQGHQDYALEFSIDGEDHSYRIDWAAPANLPLFVGANIYEAMQNAGADTDVSKLTSVIRGMGTMFEPMLALSCLSSLNDLVEGIRYAEQGEALYTIASDITTSYFTQGIPALARQTAQAMQENKQTTFANDADPTIRDLQKTAANIPFAGKNFQTDKVNAWGETESQGDWMQRTFHAFFNPGTAKKIDTGALETELNRLKEAQTENLTPPTAAKVISYTDKQGSVHKDVRLTEQQYQTLAKTQGQTAKTILDSMISSKDYAALTDEQKAKAIREVYSYARETGEIAAIGDDHTGYDESWMMEMEKGKEAEAILRRVAKSELTGAMDSLDTAWDKGYDETGNSNSLQWAYDTFKAMTPAARKDVESQITGTTAKYIEARDKGISHEQFVSAAENVAKAKGTGSNGTVRDIDRREAIANTYGLTTKQVDTIMKAYMGDYDPENGKTEKSELKYDYIRQELGLSPKAYAETYRAHLDSTKKKEKIAAIMDLGYDKKTATALYKVYAGQTDVVEWYESQ